MPGEILLTAEDNIFAWAGEYQPARPMNPKVKFVREVGGAEEFYDLDRSLFFALDTGIQRAILEMVSKPHLRPNGCVAGPPINAHILYVCCVFSISLRLALEPDLGF